MWLDTHAHLNDEAFAEDYEAVIESAADLAAVIVVGYDLASSEQAVALAAAYPKLYAAVGIHPHDAKNWSLASREKLVAWLDEEKVVALGEIGLDYYYEYSTKDEQAVAFREQLGLARELQKPVIIHNREAHQDTLQILKAVGLSERGGVMHCFSGSYETAKLCLKEGLELSFAGALTFNNASKLRELAAALPLEKLLVETDSPYLTPVPYRGKRNQPQWVKLVGQKLAEVKQLPEEIVAHTTTENAKRLFGLE